MERARWTAAAVFGLVLAANALPAVGWAQVERDDPARIAAPPGVTTTAVPGAVMLRAGDHDAVMQSLPVLRTTTLAQLRGNPRLMLGRTRVDLTPVLTRPGSVLNVAQRLQALPAVGRANAVDVQVSEIAQGLVVRSFINYQLEIGACSDERRRQVEAIGLHCRTRLSDAERTAAFSTPGNVHYVADPRARAAAIARARGAEQAVAAQTAKDVAGLRAQLKDPVQRKQIEALIGPAQAQRLSQLSDEDLAGELIDAGETKIEQVMFVPKLDAVDGHKLMQYASPPPPPPPPPPVSTDTPVDPVIYLTGFTLGRSYEWQERVDTSIKWCIIDCTRHYYAEVHAGFSYAFGLRFPIRLGGNFHYYHDSSSENATYTASFQPIDGSAADYASTGLSGDKIYNGQELVAQASANAGFSAHVPIVPDPPSFNFSVSQDFTSLLPPPFAGGQFTPPPAHSDTPKAQFIFSQVDLLGGNANFGFIGAQVFPAVEIGLHSDSLTFNLHDDVSNATTQLTANGQQVPLALSNTHRSAFTISNPVYNLGFVVTPGIDARLFIDIEVWSHDWDFPAWFPQLTIELPPDGANFSCHEGTICSHSWQYTTVDGQTIEGPRGAALGDIEAWKPAYDDKWLSQCLDDTCRFGIKLESVGTVLYAKQQLGSNDPMTLVNERIAQAKAEAEKGGAQLVLDSQVRHTGTSVDAVSALAAAVWDSKCKDKPCLGEVHDISVQMTPRAKQVQAQYPAYSTSQVLTAIGKEFTPQFQGAIDRSTVRYEVDSLGQLDEAVWDKQCLDKECRNAVAFLVGAMMIEARKMQKDNPDISALELSGAMGKAFGPQFQAQIDQSKARAAAARAAETKRQNAAR